MSSARRFLKALNECPWLSAPRNSSGGESSEPGDSSTVVKRISSSPPEPDNSSAVGNINSYSPSMPDDPSAVVKIISSSPPEPDDSNAVVKIDSSRPSEPDDFGKAVKMSSFCPSETGDSGAVVKINLSLLKAQAKTISELCDSLISSSSPSNPNDISTIVNISSSSQSEPNDSGAVEKNSSCSPQETDDRHELENVFKNLSLFKPLKAQKKVCSSSPSEPNDSGKVVKVKSSIPSKPADSDTVVKNNSFSPPEVEHEKKFEVLIDNLTLQYINVVNKENQYKRMFFECEKLKNNSKQAFKSLLVDLSNLLEQLIDEWNERLNMIISIDNRPNEAHTLLTLVLDSNNIFKRSLGINVVHKCFPDMFNFEPSITFYLVIIDDILDKSTQAKKCANWFLNKAKNQESLCLGIKYECIYNSLKLTSYANLMETSLGLNDGSDKVNMYGVYINHKKGDFEQLYLRKFQQGKKDLEQFDKKFKELEARKPRFERSRLCISEHNTPFCKLCGWSSMWLKSFKKRGIYIKEAPHWTTKHIWYNEIKEESDE